MAFAKLADSLVKDPNPRPSGPLAFAMRMTALTGGAQRGRQALIRPTNLLGWTKEFAEYLGRSQAKGNAEFRPISKMIVPVLLIPVLGEHEGHDGRKQGEAGDCEEEGHSFSSISC